MNKAGINQIDKIRYYLALLIFFNFYIGFAQESSVLKKKWELEGKSSLIFSQVSLANWSAGGNGSIAVNGMFSYSAIKTTTRFKWENYLDLGYGIIKQGDKKIDKSDDRINLSSKINYKLNSDTANKWFLNTTFDFRSQFYSGFNEDGDLISDFLSPAYFMIGVGVDYKFLDKFSISFLPISGKITIVNNQNLADIGFFGVKSAVYDVNGNKIQDGGRSRAELGMYMIMNYKSKIFDSNLTIFSNYMENFGDLDINWRNKLQANISKAISTSLLVDFIYDDDIKIAADDNDDGQITVDEIKPRIQFKSILGIGFTFNF